MSDQENFRLFVAIGIPEAIKARIAQAQAELKEALSGESISWSNAEQFHLTLKFLGKVEQERIQQLTEALRTACAPFSAMQLLAQGLGVFPDFRFPRVLWAGLKSSDNRLLELQKAVELASRPFIAEPASERFSGHVTLGRIKRLDGKGRKHLEALGQKLCDRPFGYWVAEDIELMRSELSPKGARHSCLASIPLQPAKVA